MVPISVVIVCKNEADMIGHCLKSIKDLADDIVVYDNGSSDGTQEIVKGFGVMPHEGNWEGFGKTKRKAFQLAKNDWILNLDADEVVSEELKQSLLDLTLDDPMIIYNIRFKNFFGKKYLRFGEWGNDKHLRLFNRRTVNWNNAAVHEAPVLSNEMRVKSLPGYILHQTVNNVAEYAEKTLKYSLLNAEKYHQSGKRSTWSKIYLAPAFEFIKYYFFKLGFLDGREGFICARMTAYYTFLKYARLKELEQQEDR